MMEYILMGLIIITITVALVVGLFYKPKPEADEYWQIGVVSHTSEYIIEIQNSESGERAPQIDEGTKVYVKLEPKQ